MSTLRDDEYGGLPWDKREPVMRAALDALIDAHVAAALTKQAGEIAAALITESEKFDHPNQWVARDLLQRAARIAREFGQQKPGEPS